MADDTPRYLHPIGTAPLSIITRMYTKDSYLSGVLYTRKGWHWWFSAVAPDGSSLSGQVHGPYDEENDALAHAMRVAAGIAS